MDWCTFLNIYSVKKFYEQKDFSTIVILKLLRVLMHLASGIWYQMFDFKRQSIHNAIQVNFF